MSQSPFIAVDIGNTRTKFGLFDGGARGGLPEPTTTVEMLTERFTQRRLADWLKENSIVDVAWYIGSVHQKATATLFDWLGRGGSPEIRAEILDYRRFPIQLAVEHPEKTGIDRIAGAVAANRIRKPDEPAIIVDAGTALTVDLVAADGVFRGGAILPGIGMSARALHEFTDQLPLIPMSELLEPPPALGTSTVPAMQSGLYWGAVGAMRELISRLSEGQAKPPLVILTGGAAPAVAKLLGPAARYEPNLVLSGIALAASKPN